MLYLDNFPWEGNLTLSDEWMGMGDREVEGAGGGEGVGTRTGM